MEKYLLSIEFRYKEIPESELISENKSKKLTIGVFNDFKKACIEGNKLMENLESKFNIHVFPNGKGNAKKQRFSNNGGPFGSKKTLISNLAYLKTPFCFYAKIDTLKMDDVNRTIDQITDSIKKYKEQNLND